MSPLRDPALEGLPGVVHGFFTRRGGVSEGIYASLNAGAGSRDDPAAVAQNRARVAVALGGAPDSLVTAWQAHTAIAVRVEGPWPGRPPEADALVSTRPGLLLGVLTADCAPVLLADPAAGVVGAAHAGWRGALTGVVEAAVAAMEAAGALRGRIVAAVGPCIGPASYEVGLEFLDRFVAQDPGFARFFSPGASPDKRLFDLPAFVVARLAAAGVREAGWLGRDTCAEADDFFSNRRAVKRGEGDYGRLISVVGLR